MVEADGLPGMRVSCSWGSGNDSLDVMLDSGQGSVREALAVDNRERKGVSALSISYRVVDLPRLSVSPNVRPLS